MSRFKPGDEIMGAHHFRAASRFGLSAAELEGFDRRLDAAAARNRYAFARVLRDKRIAQTLSNLIDDLKESSLNLQAALERHARGRATRVAASLASGLLLLALTACGGAYESPPPAPDCSPGNTDVQLVVAPPDIEFPSCTELPCSAYCSETASRQWCCWKGTVVR